jgi:hypothetical protein
MLENQKGLMNRIAAVTHNGAHGSSKHEGITTSWRAKMPIRSRPSLDVGRDGQRIYGRYR